MIKINSVLVAIDFSECSLHAFKFAKGLVSEDGEIILLHVVDTPFLDKIDALGVGEIHEIKENLKNKAENAFKTIIDNENSTGLTIDTMVVEGVPFLEILKISKDLDVSMILLGKRSDRKDVSQFFFGSVAEKVIRLSPIPVIVIP